MPKTLEAVRDATRNIPIDGPFVELAQEVRRLLGWYEQDGRPFLTSRMAARKTGFSHASFIRLARGEGARARTLDRIAEVLGGDAALLRRLAGFPAGRKKRFQNPTPEDFRLTPPEARLLSLFRALPSEEKSRLLALAQRGADDA